MTNAVGIDLGGTKIAGARVDQRGKVQKFYQCPTNATASRAVILQNILDVIEQVATEDIIGVGIGIPGFTARGKVAHMPNIPHLMSVDMQRFFERRLHLPVTVENDAKCFTLAEWKFGAGRGVQNLIGVTLGTGIGSGFILNGNLYRGSHGAAGEIGHTLLYPQTRNFTFGTNTLEAAMRSLPQKQNLHSFLPLAFGLANLVMTLDPERIVIGGGLSKRNIHHYLQAQTKKRVIPSLAQHVSIVKTKLGERAGSIGAASLIFAADRKV